MKDYTEILIPLHHDILKEVNRENKSIKINAPEGLIDIYMKNKDDDDEND
jgi:16S rRNA processing protein RimM